MWPLRTTHEGNIPSGAALIEGFIDKSAQAFGRAADKLLKGGRRIEQLALPRTPIGIGKNLGKSFRKPGLNQNTGIGVFGQVVKRDLTSRPGGQLSCQIGQAEGRMTGELDCPGGDVTT